MNEGLFISFNLQCSFDGAYTKVFHEACYRFSFIFLQIPLMIALQQTDELENFMMQFTVNWI